MSKEKCMNKKLHPYYRTGVYGWIGEEVDDNDYIICPICGNILGMNYWDYQAENDGDNKCPKCKQELDYSEIYEFEDTCYYEQLVEMKNQQIADLEAKLAESESEVKVGEFWHSAYQGKQLDYDKVYAELRQSYDENEQLKQQLAEKEKEITQRLVIQERDYNQEKISFALEQLEKVRQSFIYNYNNDICCVDPYDNHCCLSLTTTIYNNTIDIFNNQIKQLKEGK